MRSRSPAGPTRWPARGRWPRRYRPAPPRPEPRFMLLPMSEVEVVDDWFTVGMRGTGSCSIRVADAVVPEHRTLNVAAAAGGSTPAALFSIVAPMSLVGPPLGMARGALETF